MSVLKSTDWRSIWTAVTLILSILIGVRLLINKKQIRIPDKFMYFLGLAIVIFFILEPIQIYSDKWSYKKNFETIRALKDDKIFDYGFYVFNLIINYVSQNFGVFLLVSGIIYVFGYTTFIKAKIPGHFRFIFFVVTLISLGFYGYGTNTIRQGLGLSLFLIAISKDHKKYLYYLFLVLSVLFHKSLLLPILAISLVSKFRTVKIYYFVWVLFLLVSLVTENIFGEGFSESLTGLDKVNTYLEGEDKRYSSGFRVDFLIYSFIPIVYGRYILQKIEDKFYNKLFASYILINAFWLLFIRIPFTDRVAYLSWFLIPFIFLYPLANYKLFKNQNAMVAFVVIYMSFISYITS